MTVQKSWQCFNIALLIDTIRLCLILDLGVLCQIPFLTPPAGMTLHFTTYFDLADLGSNQGSFVC